MARVTDGNDAASATGSGAAGACGCVDSNCSSGGGIAPDEDTDGDELAARGAGGSGGFPREDCLDTNPDVDRGLTAFLGTPHRAIPSMKGRLAYFSPEQARAETLGPRSDSFSLGRVLHEMLTGTPPFGGTRPEDVLAAVVGSPAPRLPATVPPVVATIVARLLAKRPEDRPELSVVADELERLATAHGGQYKDVVVFLHAEVGDLLRCVRRRLQVLAGGAPPGHRLRAGGRVRSAHEHWHRSGSASRRPRRGDDHARRADRGDAGPSARPSTLPAPVRTTVPRRCRPT